MNREVLCPLLLMFCTIVIPGGSFASTISYDQCPTCGPTGGPALQIFFTGVTAPSTQALGLVNTSMSFSPSSIGAINATADKDVTISQATPFTGTFASGLRPLVEQDATIYILNPAIAGPTFGSNTVASTSFTSGWGTIQSSTGFTLSSFVEYSFATGKFGTATPNGTDPVFFGLAAIGTTNNTQIVDATNETDFANVSFTDADLLVDATFSDLANYQAFTFASVPEPSTTLLLGLGLVYLCWRGGSKLRSTS